MEKLMEISHVGYSYHTMQGETPALSNINFTVHKGDFLAIVGPSGCGKSTLLSLLAGLLEPEHGSIFLYGQKVSQKGNRSIGYMLQHDHLFEWRTVEKNVLLGLEIQHKLCAETRESVLDMLKTYGLYQFKDARPSQLSGGMRQRAALIRTLALKPEILLLDEPFSALDMLTKSAVHDWYLQVMETIHLSTLFVTHDIEEAILLSDRIYLLTGTPGSVTKEIRIEEPRPRKREFSLSERFLDYKRQILMHLEKAQG